MSHRRAWQSFTTRWQSFTRRWQSFTRRWQFFTRSWQSFTRRRQSFTRRTAILHKEEAILHKDVEILRSKGINIFNETRKKFKNKKEETSIPSVSLLIKSPIQVLTGPNRLDIESP